MKVVANVLRRLYVCPPFCPHLFFLLLRLFICTYMNICVCIYVYVRAKSLSLCLSLSVSCTCVCAVCLPAILPDLFPSSYPSYVCLYMNLVRVHTCIGVYTYILYVCCIHVCILTLYTHILVYTCTFYTHTCVRRVTYIK